MGSLLNLLYLTMIKLNGILTFDPPAVTSKHRRQADWKVNALISMDCDLSRYYGWFIKRRYDVILNTPLRGSHITVLNDRYSDTVNYEAIRELWSDKTIEFEYNSDVRTNGKTWWLPVQSTAIEDIRESIGLSRIPYYPLHITIGSASARLDEKGEDMGGSNLEHSNYIHRCITRFEN